MAKAYQNERGVRTLVTNGIESPRNPGHLETDLTRLRPNRGPPPLAPDGPCHFMARGLLLPRELREQAQIWVRLKINRQGQTAGFSLSPRLLLTPLQTVQLLAGPMRKPTAFPKIQPNNVDPILIKIIY